MNQVDAANITFRNIAPPQVWDFSSSANVVFRNCIVDNSRFQFLNADSTVILQASQFLNTSYAHSLESDMKLLNNHFLDGSFIWLRGANNTPYVINNVMHGTVNQENATFSTINVLPDNTLTIENNTIVYYRGEAFLATPAQKKPRSCQECFVPATLKILKNRFC